MAGYSEDRYDAIIVGARCAGSATARLLAQQGLRTLVVDRATFPSDTVSTHCVNGSGVVMLQRWGLLDAVKETNVPHVFGFGARLGEIDLPDAPAPAAAFGTISPRRTVLDKLLVDAARAEGAEVREGFTVKDLRWDDQRERVVGISGHDADGSPVVAQAEIVIGADGANSAVAKAVGAERYDERPSQVSGSYAYFSGCVTDKPNLAFSDRHFGFAFPTNDGELCIGTGCVDARFGDVARGGDEALLANLCIASPRLADDMRRGARQSRWFTFRAQPGRKHKPYGRGWALVGDAGYYKDPLTGLGISDAFVSAQLLANAIAAGGDEAAMRTFHEQRDALTADLYITTHRFASLEWSNDELFEMFAAAGTQLDQLATAAAALP
jgi:flavin-dependent dehydrogenase